LNHLRDMYEKWGGIVRSCWYWDTPEQETFFGLNSNICNVCLDDSK